jgi:uncharacterized protein with GYD domain
LTGEVPDMKFIGLIKFRKKVDKDLVGWTLKTIASDEKAGIHFQNIFWTLGRYDAVAIYDAPDERAAMKIAIARGDIMNIETLVAVPAEEARKLVE